MKKRYWVALVSLGAIGAGWWLHRKTGGALGRWIAGVFAGLLARLGPRRLQLTDDEDVALRQRWIEWASPQPSDRVLDIDHDTGRTALAIARALGPQASVFCAIPSDQQLEFARQQARDSDLSVSFRTADATSLPFASGRFNLVSATLIWHRLSPKKREAVVAEAARVLRLGGRLFLADTSPVADREVLASPSFRLLKTEDLDFGTTPTFLAIAERISKNPPKPKKGA
jgi:ubiquinone/menaquinone biosynthesis C-methylase UbiE